MRVTRRLGVLLGGLALLIGAAAAPSSAAATALPSSFTWSSSGMLISPKSDATHSLSAIKDPSVVYSGG